MTSQVTIFIDALDLLEDVHQATTLDWIPEDMPKVNKEFTLDIVAQL